MFKRIVIKISGEALSKQEGESCQYQMFNNDNMNLIIQDILKVQAQGTEISVVLGGGNIWRGRNADEKMDRTKADQIGMLATVINSIYFADMIGQNGSKAIVMTPFKVGTMTTEFSKEAALSYMQSGHIVIFAGGLGHPFFSTDTIPALRAAELDSDCILFAKNIDGVYDKNPSIHRDAKRYKEITYRKVIKDNLAANDLAAMILCEDNNIPSLVFALNYPQSISIACQNDERLYQFGTKIIYNEKEDYYVN